MSEPIESGLISSLFSKNTKGLAKAFGDWFKTLGSKDKIELIKSKEIHDGETHGILMQLASGSHKANVKVLNSESEGIFDVYIVGDNGKKSKYLNKSDRDVQNCIIEFFESEYKLNIRDKESKQNIEDIDITDEEFNDNQSQLSSDMTSASKKIQIELSRIQSSQEVISGKIYCNYEPNLVYSDLEEVLDSAEFINDLTEDSQTFEIIPEDDSYSIVPIDTIEPMDATSEILKQQYILLFKLENSINHIETYGELAVSPLDVIEVVTWQRNWLLGSKLAAHVNIVDILKSIDFNDLYAEDLSQCIEDYCICLDLFYPNFDHEVQSLIDEWILTLRYDR